LEFRVTGTHGLIPVHVPYLFLTRIKVNQGQSGDCAGVPYRYFQASPRVQPTGGNGCRTLSNHRAAVIGPSGERREFQEWSIIEVPSGVAYTP
jgi:hypothetical protein